MYSQLDPTGANYGGKTSAKYQDFFNVPTSARGQFEKFSNEIYDKISKVKPQEAQALKNELTMIGRDLLREKETGDISPMMFNSKGAVLNEALKTTNELIRSLSVEKSKTDAAKTTEPKKLAEVAKANKAVQVIVNIENLVRELTNVNQQASNLNQLTTDGTLKALTVAVDNIYSAGQV